MLNIIRENISSEIKKMHDRLSMENRSEIDQVQKIVQDVRQRKDVALKEYTQKFDHAHLDEFAVDFLEMESAYTESDTTVITSLRLAIKNIAEFHYPQRPTSWKKEVGQGSTYAWRYTPLRRIGIYVPGGTASYVSSVLMNAIPAKIAGVEEIVMVTPPNAKGKINPLMLVAAKEVGISEIYKIGGAQAIAALAYGTESIAPVLKITGPGNVYVSLAKKMVSGDCGIDKYAGPSDILILADDSANPDFIAADLLAQAEHDVLSSAILVTTSEHIAQKVNQSLLKQINPLSRQDISYTALKNFGCIFLAHNRQQMIDITNQVAPEHLEIMTRDADKIADHIENAGAIFLGDYSPVALGDYMAGPNHVLPTHGTARFDSPLSVMDFVKATSMIHFTQDTFRTYTSHIQTLSNLEGLDAHARSCAMRE